MIFTHTTTYIFRSIGFIFSCLRQHTNQSQSQFSISVTQSYSQQQSYQVDTPHNLGNASGGDHTHGVNLL